jgi:protein-disulfide isomerase
MTRRTPKHSLRLAACLLLPLVACQPRDPADGPVTAESEGTGEVAAEVEGVPITVAELDAWIKEDLFRSQTASAARLYELRENSLQRLIADRVLAIEAERRGVSGEKLIALEVAELGPVRDEEVADFYESNKQQLGEISLDDVKDRIRNFLAAQRENQAREGLLGAAEVVVFLEPPRISVASTGPSRGPENARITIVEFSDFQCPFCRRVLPTIEQVLAKYPEDVRVVYRNFPLGGHARARPAAEAALCADEQDGFWPYHDLLFANPRQLDDEDLLRYANEMELDAERFEKCLKEHRFASQVEADMMEGQQAGVTGTPSFFVNGINISGAKPADDFFQLIEAELARLEEGA